MKSFKEYMSQDRDLSINEQDTYQQVKDTIDKETRRIRSNLFDDAKMIGRIAEAMKAHGWSNRDVAKVKDAEKKMDEARQILTKI